jgi:hypothetical protein
VIDSRMRSMCSSTLLQRSVGKLVGAGMGKP